MRSTLPVVAVVLAALVCSETAAQPCPPCEPDESPACCWSVDADYVLWWLRRGRVPGVLVSDQGVVYRDDRVETRHGDRFNGIRFALEWRDASGLGVEGRGFFLERDSTYFKATSDGSQLLALPFFNAATGLPDRLVVAGLDPKRGPLAGEFVGYSRIELFGEEVNGIAPLIQGESGRLDLLAGARFLQMRDRFRAIATSQTLPAHNVLTGVVDNFRTGNAFNGAQVGVRGEWWWQRFFVQVRASAALGGDDQKVRTFGQRVVQTTSGRTEIETGLYVQASNSGQFTRGQVDGVGEVAVNLGYTVGEHVRVTAGYTFLDWFAPLRAGDQVDRMVNPVPATAPARPAVPFKSDALWAQGLNVGLEVRW
jgi:hypothetical protein